MKDEGKDLSIDVSHRSLKKSRAIQYLPMTNDKYQMINYKSLPSSLIPHPSAFLYDLSSFTRTGYFHLVAILGDSAT